MSYWNDNKYTLLTIVSLIFCYVMIGLFWRRDPTPGEELESDRPRTVPVTDEELEAEDEEDEDDEAFDEDGAPAPA